MAEVVRELVAKIGILVDRASLQKADSELGRYKEKLGKLHDAASGRYVASAGRNANSAALGFGNLAAAAAVAAGTMLFVKKTFIDFNDNMEQSTISLAAMQKMFKGGTWAESMSTATGLFEHYQEVAKASVGETKDFIEMHKGIAASAYQAGASLDDLKEITKGAVIASASMGESAIVSAMDVKQALSKGVSVRDRFMVNLLAAEKVTAAQFNALSKGDRIKALKKALTADWIKDASKQMEFSFAGVTSTFRDNLSIALGKVGKNYFAGMTESVKKINEWIEKNPESWKKFQGLAETGLTALSNLAKGLAGVLSIAIKPALGLLEGLQAIQDEGKYKAKELSAKGMQEAFNQGPEAFDRYMRRKYYKTEADPDFARSGGAGQSASKLQKELAGDYEKMDWIERLAYKAGRVGGPSAMTPARQRRESDWVDKHQATYGRAPTSEELDSYRTDEESMWRQGKITATGQGGYSAGPVMSSPEANYSSGYGTARFAAPDLYSPYGNAPGTSGPSQVTGDINIKVKVDVPNMSTVVEQVLETKFREGNELMSQGD